MSYEILELITEAQMSTEEKVEYLHYLYGTTTDYKLQDLIKYWFIDNNYCINCGEKLKYNEWQECHTELCGNPREIFSEWYCPHCD